MSEEWKEPNNNQQKALSPQWICLACKTVVGPVVDDDKHRCNCKDGYLVDLWLVAPVEPKPTHKEMSIYEIYSGLQDFLVSSSDDGDGYMQYAPEEVKAKQRKEIEDLTAALKLLYPFALNHAEIYNLRTDIL
jgi:hypothetical protein